MLILPCSWTAYEIKVQESVLAFVDPSKKFINYPALDNQAQQNVGLERREPQWLEGMPAIPDSESQPYGLWLREIEFCPAAGAIPGVKGGLF